MKYLQKKTIFLRHFACFIVIVFSLLNTAFSQAPQKVFEILDILVDGCAGSDEGRNEMVLFHIGPNPVNIADLRIDGAGDNGVISSNRWPNSNNIWRGIAPPPAKPAEVSQINATILNCGLLIEPVGGILPAGKKVLMITSTEFSPMAHSFTSLQDTLYVIFQNAGNTAGHFVNYGTPSSFRTLVLMHLPTNVGDTVMYDRSLLVNQSQQPGAQDGAAVAYDWPGNATFYNNGCQALYHPLDASWNSPDDLCSSYQPINLDLLIIGTPGGTWSGTGVSGNLFNPTGLSGVYYITYTVGPAPCAVTETNEIVVIASPSATWTVPQPMCDNSSTVSLDSFVTGTPGGSWSGTGISGNLFNPSGLSGLYQVTYTAGIPPCQASVTHVIQVIGSASAEWNAPAWFCANQLPVQLSGTVSGTTGGTWSGPGITNAVNGTFNPASAGAGSHVITYAVSGMCGDTVSHTIAVFPVPSFTITSTGESCAGAADGSAALQVAGGNPPYSYSWSNQSTSPSVNLLAPGDYTFTITDANLCSVSGLLTIPFSVEDCVPTDIFVPNIFSPDGNDLNDVLYVRGPAIVTMKFLIYNRWGQKVFESHHINHGWNGTYKGINAETGVYTWMLDARLQNGENIPLSGNVTLVR